MNSMPDYRDTLDKSIDVLFDRAGTLFARNPAMALYILKTAFYQKRASSERKRQASLGVQVPPIMIASITNRCNLHCKGCYNRAQHRLAGDELSSEEWRRIFIEARNLGVSIVLLAGGEPLVRPEVLNAAASVPEIVFPVFSNGLLIDDRFVRRLERSRNLIPVLSVEGHEDETDQRRGEGVYDRLSQSMSIFHDAGIFFGMSLTVTSANYDVVTSESFVRECINKGCGLFFFVEYVPVAKDTGSLALSDNQKDGMLATSRRFRDTLPGLFVAFPGDEDELGGCVAAGKGFVHVSATGDLEPCPFSPYSDTNLRFTPLKDALSSKFLQAVRSDEERLSRTKGGCALFENRDWVASLLK